MKSEALHPDESQRGSRDARGHWKPYDLIEYPPVFTWPPKPRRAVKWLIGGAGWVPYLVCYAALAVAFWLFLTPSMSTMETFAVGWIAFLFVRNAFAVVVAYGIFHFRLYMKKKQGTAFKYNEKWPSGNSAFLFGRQNVDNVIWTMGSGVPIWTAYEALTLWAFANGIIPYVSFSEHPVYCIILFILINPMREAHFYLIHRLIHIPVFYRIAHKVHHNNVNPGPWSGLAMHPLEHMLYFSGVFIHWIVPSNPVHAVFHLVHAAFVPLIPHSGFDELALDDEHTIKTGAQAHYLHHKLFECNYADGLFPFDKWFGTFHDGSDEAEGRMNQRLAERARKQAEKAAQRSA